MTQKSSLRKKMRTILSQVSEKEITEASHTICEHFSQYFTHNSQSSLTPSYPVSTIAVYSAHGPEIHLGALHALLPHHTRLVYPLCHAGGKLSFHQVDEPTNLSPGTLGILEPDPEKHPLINIPDINIFLCPGLAFGRDGTRLGHGGGYYDRALEQRSQSSITIGIGLKIQIQNTVPHDPHDILLDHILTEASTLPLR